MNKLYDVLKEHLSEVKNFEYAKYLTDHFPRRISGMGDDRKAAKWVVSKFKEFGLEAEVVDFEAYNSNPVFSEVVLIRPETMIMESRPCCHIASTPKEGLEVEVVYLAGGDYADYEGKDVKGKAVLVEVSFAPGTPEKARIAAEKGASVIICANWGEDKDTEHDYVCGRGLKAVWGNPTPETFKQIPQIVGVGVTHAAGLYMKEKCLKGEKVIVRVKVQSTRTWDKLPMPVGYLRGSEEPEKYLLVNGHLDAWEPGVTCNATGNGTIIHLAELLAKHRDLVKRSIYFICWNGHEIAESAGSTWYIDQHWDDLEKNCIGGVNIDSTGMLDATEYRCTASSEIKVFVQNMVKEVLNEEIEVKQLDKYGDMSFFGIGISAIVGRMSMSDEYIKRTNGASMGWWAHTIQDSLDKVDLSNLTKDLQIDAAIISSYVSDSVLPFDFTTTCLDIEQKLLKIIEKADKKIELSSILTNTGKLQRYAVQMNKLRKLLEDKPINDQNVRFLNELYLSLGRSLTWAFYTCCDRFEQDSYAYTPASHPIPLLYTAVDLAQLNSDSLEYKLELTRAMRNRNRVSSALSSTLKYCELYLAMIEKLM